MPYSWDPNSGATGRYRDLSTGRYVAAKTVRSELDGYLSASDNTARSLADALRGRSISLADWQQAMRAEIKATHLNAIALERGGWANMRPSDYGRAGQIVHEQYGYLERFAAQIADGTQKLDGTLARRAQLYIDMGRNSFYQSAHANVQPGITRVRSIRHASRSCAGCSGFDGVWYRLGDPAYVLPGRRQCNANCLCSEEYAGDEVAA